ncbi:MAG: hypothetical protein FGM61_08750 [Sediminibacterium sp.]|nr:hypothetical protein [Sediminibacterium sp.]
MKKLVAISLLLILLFNWGGYRLLSNWMASHAQAQFQSVLDEEQYNEADLLHIKVPATLPYGVSNAQFEKVEGSIEMNGVSYSYVKRRFYQDTLELLCLPNIQTTQIKNARDAFAQLANDFISHEGSAKKTNSNPASAKWNLSDFTQDHLFFSWQFREDVAGANWNTFLSKTLPIGILSGIEHPPCAVA